MITQVMQRERLNAGQLRNYYINAARGACIPALTFVRLRTDVVPESLNHFQQLNSATVSAVPAAGVTLGEA